MPTAQSSSTESSNKKSNKGVTSNKPNVDNKIAKAAAKVAASVDSSAPRNNSQENTRATTPDQQQQSTQGYQGTKTPQEQPEFIRQALDIIVKKVRNLEKRRIKLEEYRDIQAKGTPLNEDQLLAISRYDEVLRTLEFSREMEKQFYQLASEATKQQKKQLKKEQIEREEAIREKLKEGHKILAVLNTFGDETIRNDFLNELNGATKLSEQEMNALDEFNKIVQPPSEINSRIESLSVESSENVFNLIEGKNKQIAQLNAQVVGAAFTYADLKKLFDRILGCGYWQQRENATTVGAASGTGEQTLKSDEIADPLDHAHLTEHIGQMNMNNDDPAGVQQQNENHSNIPLEQVYHQQNTSEDYILVSSSDYNENNPNKQGSRTFFSTLNPQDSGNRNINEFLNRCENNDDGINFLQDSEIQHHDVQQPSSEHIGQDMSQNHHHQQAGGDHYQSGGQMSQSQNFGNFQEFNQDTHKDNRGPKREYNGPRNNNNNYQRPRYQDDQRGPRRGPGGPNNGMMNNQAPRNNGNDRNGGGYRGNRGSAGNGGGNRASGEYRSGGGGSGGYQGGVRSGGGGQRYPPRQDNRQQVAQN